MTLPSAAAVSFVPASSQCDILFCCGSLLEHLYLLNDTSIEASWLQCLELALSIATTSATSYIPACHTAIANFYRVTSHVNHSVNQFERALSYNANHVPALIGLANIHAKVSKQWQR